MNKLRLNYLLEMNLIQAWCGNPITWEAEVGKSGVQGHPGIHETLSQPKNIGSNFWNYSAVKTLLLKSNMKI